MAKNNSYTVSAIMTVTQDIIVHVTVNDVADENQARAIAKDMLDRNEYTSGSIIRSDTSDNIVMVTKITGL